MAATAIVFHSIFSRNELPADSLEMRYSQLPPDAYPRRTVRFESDGNQLCGYVYDKGVSNRLLLMAHGFHGGADSYLSEVQFFVDRGWTVLTFDGTGTRESEGDSVVGLAQMRQDVEAALAYIRTDTSLCELPVAVYGHSMGGYAAACAADEGVAAVVSVSGFNEPVEMMCGCAQTRIGVLAKLGLPFLELQNFLTGGADANETAVDALNTSGTPALIISGTADEVIPQGAAIDDFQEEITNPRVQYLQISAPFRSAHSTSWLSQDAVIYRAQVQRELDVLHTRYGTPLPQNVYDEFCSRVDFFRLNALDESFMRTVNAFLLAAMR